MTGSPDLMLATGSAEAELRVRASRFVAVTHPVGTLAEALEVREGERRRFHDATHHVFAVRTADGDTRFDDDGEPAGTGGRPVLQAIDAAGLSGVAVVVTRYYGGTRLGTGGLGRAYASAAAEALAATPCRHMVRGRRVRLTFGYEDTGSVQRVLDRCRAIRLQEGYGADVVLEIGLPEGAVEACSRELVDATAGRVRAVPQHGQMLLPHDT